ncbi:MAG: radical SAM protein [Desulfobacterales bacterium]|nr:radical SAM protein [Desulfobacterales bacterium]
MRACPPDAVISILASRGCYNHCRFCPIPSFYNKGPEWNGREPKHIFAEINKFVEQGYTKFYFADPNFIGPGENGRERTLELIKLIRPLKITFGMETRPNDLTSGILEKLVAAGLNSLLLGIESGSKSVLGSLDKYSSKAVSERAIRLCREAGIEPEVGFLMFVPDSTVLDLRDNFDFLKNNNLLDRLDRTTNLLSHCQIVLHGTSGYDRFREEGRLRPTGMFGFEGEVAYRDETVAWMSELVVYACHYVLREMENNDSPVFWEKPRHTPAHISLNDYLVFLFERLLHLANTGSALPTAVETKNDLLADLRKQIEAN